MMEYKFNTGKIKKNLSKGLEILEKLEKVSSYFELKEVSKMIPKELNERSGYYFVTSEMSERVTFQKLMIEKKNFKVKLSKRGTFTTVKFLNEEV